ncbi:MAG: phosphoribosylanthranilate isomerase [Actinomycetota bacterium]|nr:phosphoribosylanthranilate isomerase [Actinomycetota bacterium]
MRHDRFMDKRYFKGAGMAGVIQVAGVIDAAEAVMLAECGVDWLGFPLRLAVNKEDLSEEQAAEIIAGIRPPQRGILITYEVEAGDISAFCRKLGVRTVQVHANVPANQLRALKQVEPGLVILKSLVVRGDNQQDLAAMVEETYEWVDMYITDTFDPATGAEGATGLVHDWQISADLVQRSPRPVMLAGGLNPDNVDSAIRKVRPAAVDAHTGLEDSAGRKDQAKVQRFVANARHAFAQIASDRGHWAPFSQ